jgi:chromosome segregation ATPase
VNRITLPIAAFLLTTTTAFAQQPAAVSDPAAQELQDSWKALQTDIQRVFNALGGYANDRNAKVAQAQKTIAADGETIGKLQKSVAEANAKVSNANARTSEAQQQLTAVQRQLADARRAQTTLPTRAVPGAWTGPIGHVDPGAQSHPMSTPSGAR